jgi:hypothetical protein
VLPPEKIEEWIQEVQERPSSASIIIQYIANRLRDLSEWNENLRTENLALRSGQRVDDYERQIAHLEYQLELLKRQVNGELDLDELGQAAPMPKSEPLNLLAYDPQGRVNRLEIGPDEFRDGDLICRFAGIQEDADEPPRLLIVSPTEELMLIFTSGRIVTLPASRVPLSKGGGTEIDWGQALIPEEPNLGETLACVAPVSKMALADFYLQISRRGYAKKIRTALAPTIMQNKFIGTGVKVSADQTLTLMMCRENACFVLVSHQGYLQYISEALLPYAIVEAMRMGKTDHLVAAFPIESKKSILVMTQIGKVIHRTIDSLETATDLRRKGRMLYNTARRDAGVRVVGAAAVTRDDRGIALHRDGRVTLHTISDLIAKGSLEVQDNLLDFITSTVPSPVAEG